VNEVTIIDTECYKDLDKLNLVKLAYEVKVLGSSRFSLLPQLPLKMMLTLKVFKSDCDKKITSLC